MPNEIRLGDEVLTVVTSTADELVMEADWAAGASAPPPHLHPNQDEHFEVLEGELTVVMDGGAERVLRAGDTLDVPRGTAHKMWNPSAGRTRARWEVRPALRTESFFRDMAEIGGPKASPLAAAGVLKGYRDEFRLALPAGLEPAAVHALAAAGKVLRHR
ncbi:MAG: cupin domain-containing protein [Solirubrobacteraceae bacterium]|nr:cupin domain-containing protein [Solirubrobacteraceae bacterium]